MKGSLKPDTIISHYRILTKIGAGGMGEVFLAEDTRLNRKIAIKILPADVAANEDRMRRFIQEAKCASALNHPNIITIYEIDQVDSVYFIASEFIDGQTLRERMRDETLKLGQALDFALQISSALSAAHVAGIIHRDIKPDNIMLRRDGIVKVLDFGLAKLTERPPSQMVDPDAPTRAVVKTEPGVVLGTAIYMSPEQARGLTLDGRTDIFSLGVVLYEMMAGCLPFKGKATTEVFAEIISEHEPPPLARYSREVPAELERIVSKALRKDRDERYQTIKDLLLDLQSLKQDLEFEKKLAISQKSKTFTANRKQVTAIGRTNSDIRRSPNVIELKRRNILIAAVLTLAAVIGAYLYFGRTRRGAIDSIAVLPLVNASNNPDTEYLSDGISESLINSLSQLPGVKVIASTSSLRYKGKEVDPKEVARTLGVGAILTGRVSQREDNLLINVELIRADDKTQIWGEQYDRKATDLLSVQREIAREITSNLRLKLSGAEQGRVTKHYTENPEAYQLYLKGRFYWNKRTGDAAKKAVEYFQRAIEIDPNYALAYAGLADAYQLLNLFADASPQEAFPKAKTAAKRALELDETLAEAHTSLASSLFLYDRNYPEAEREFLRAIQLNPNYATAHHWYGVTYLAKMERFDEAIAELKRAQELDPFSLVINADFGNTYIQARQYDKAIEQLRTTIQMDQNFYVAHMFLGMAYQMKGNFQDAIAEFQKARQLNDDPFVLALLGDIYALSGRKDEALKILDQLKQLSKQRFVYAYGVALVYVGLGDKDQAFQWLEKSFQDHEARINRLKVDPLFDSVRSDPRYADLIHRIGLS
jgi:serine/threonine protein kinase/Tfp pilus assembly protein PilF